jgi:hypothetical protein
VQRRIWTSLGLGSIPSHCQDDIRYLGGAVVPSQAAVMAQQICVTCNGSGKCPTCGGAGAFQPIADSVVGIQAANLCASCFGSGLCRDCHGTTGG